MSSPRNPGERLKPATVAVAGFSRSRGCAL